MKPGPIPPPPNEAASDPLLAALRQRLGSYGQAPPPAAWAAIRRRVAPPPAPWWRRPRHLLPLLVLLTGLLLVSKPTGRYNPEGLTRQPAPTVLAPAGRAVSPGATTRLLFPKTAGREHAALSAGAAPSAPAAATVAERNLPATASAPSLELGTTAAPTRSASQALLAVPHGAKEVAAPRHQAATARWPKRLIGSVAAASYSHQKTMNFSTQRATIENLAAIAQPNAVRPADRHRPQAARRASRLATLAINRKTANTKLTVNSSDAHSAPVNPAHLLASHWHARRGRGVRQSGAAAEPSISLAGLASGATLAGLTPSRATKDSSLLPLFTERSSALDTLALKQPSLLLPGPALLPALVARPDSTRPPQVARRWSLLVLAGPTLSYRTLGPAPALAAGHPDFARLERPALGLGAQVQMRRVLSGRWAVAAGVGYHEYTTRLALSVRDSNTYTTVRQRDSYRLLTVPVQFSYALGAPRGRLAVGLLAGAELGWYVGGRSTEGSDCGCQQRVYPTDSTRTSPYRPLSLAFSLGLDLRYRLGGPASRWHLVVQPTGRYVATPFVRSEAVGYTRRQPWSLGLLTGFSWDLR